MARDRDDEYDDRPPRRRDRDHDDMDDYADDPSSGGAPRRPIAKGMNVCGLIALILGIIGLLLAVIPCVGIIGIPIAAVGLLLGIIGLMTAGKTTGRGLPIAGTCVSLAGLLIGGAWLAFFVYGSKQVQKDVEVMQAEMEKQQQIAEANRLEAEKQLRDGKATTVSAKKLADDYDGNPINADSKYKDKVLEITGTVERVDRDRFGKSWIEFKTDSNLVLKCEFTKDAQKELVKVEAKKEITLRGRCKGKTKPIGKNTEEITLSDCVLVSKVGP